MIPVTNRVEATRFGRANGNLLKNSLSPKRSGNFFAGEARAPPSIGPKTLPIDQTYLSLIESYTENRKESSQTRGITLNARGCIDFCGTSSATIMLISPYLHFQPFSPNPSFTYQSYV